MSQDRAQILQMISSGEVSAEKGAQLLTALQSPQPKPEPAPTKRGHWFHVRVTDLETDRVKVNVNLPLALIGVATKMGARFSPEMEGVDWNELVNVINEGAVGKLVEVEDLEGQERVEVFVD